MPITPAKNIFNHRFVFARLLRCVNHIAGGVAPPGGGGAGAAAIRKPIAPRYFIIIFGMRAPNRADYLRAWSVRKRVKFQLSPVAVVVASCGGARKGARV